ncbi:MAG TPA: hypothetical protein VFA75_10890 [Nevskia sp.]|jgi:hypothetical protein|nr:hypothetical protein [Nevskia sp.]
MSTPDPLPRRTGLHKLDLFVGACALLVSAVSLFIGWQSNRTQQRMLAASVWPYLSWDTSNYNEQSHEDEVSLEIRNVGVGPARIESLQLFYQGKPLADFRELVDACCKAEVEGLRRWSSRTSTVNPVVIPAHDSVRFFAVIKAADNAALWDKFNRERFQVQGRACYCSVLDDCWVLDSSKIVPEAVSRCPAPAGVQYR